MAASNISGRAQRHAIVNSPLGTEFLLSPLDKPQESSYRLRATPHNL